MTRPGAGGRHGGAPSALPALWETGQPSKKSPATAGMTMRRPWWGNRLGGGVLVKFLH